MSLFEFLRSKGWRVVIAGRNMKGAAAKYQLNRFTRDEIAQAASHRPDLRPYMTDQADAIVDVLATLSFEGNPLWLQVAMNLLEGLLAQDEDLEVLAKKPDYLHQCFEEEDPFDSGEDYGIEGGQCKLQLIGTLTRHIEGLEDQAWKIALPRVLDKGVVGQLFEADQARVVLHNFEVAGVFRHSGKQFSLHEEIRDLLLAYARSKGWLDSEETRGIHGRLWGYFNEFYLGKLPSNLRELASREKLEYREDFEKLEVQFKEYIPLNWMLEACYHRIFSLDKLADASVNPQQFWKALAGVVFRPPLEKWHIVNKLPSYSHSQVSDLVQLCSDEFEMWCSLLGGSSAKAMLVEESAGNIRTIDDIDFWKRRVDEYGLAGDYYWLQECLREQPNTQLATIEKMLRIYQKSDDFLTQVQCAEALLSKGHLLLDKLDNPQEAIRVYDEVVRCYGKNESPEIQGFCITALYNKGWVTDEKFDDPESGVQVYAELITLYFEVDVPEVQEQCAHALSNISWIFAYKLDRPQEAVKSYSILIECYGDICFPSVQELYVDALYNKGMILSSMDDLPAAIICYEDLLARYAQSENPQIQQKCQSARANLAEFTLINGQSEVALNHINQLLEQSDKITPDFAIMHFLRWMAAPETPQQSILNAIRELPTDMEYSWSWDEIRPLINQLLEPRKIQAKHYIAFFEEHHDIERLESELESVIS